MDESNEQKPDVTVTGAEPSQPAEADGTVQPQPAAEAATASEPAAATPQATEGGESSEFLRSLLSAMRSVAESSRDSSVAELREAVEARIEELKAAAATQADELRRLADQDIAGVEEWEKAELERVRAEAERRREERRTQLGQQLAEHQAASQRDIEETRRRLADHERELAEFFAQLEGITDPAGFVAAAQRMPRAPELSPAPAASMPAATPSAEPAETTAGDAPSEPAAGEPAWPEPTTPSTGGVDTRLAERLAELDARLAGEVQADKPAEVATQPATAAVQNGNGSGESSTAIVVKGLGSFGAITSFKQALERIEGIKGVTLSLGPTGEFVYRASHAAEFDVAGAIRSIEGPSATIDESEGSLLVTVNRGR